MGSFSEHEVRHLLDLSRRCATGGMDPAAKKRRVLSGLCRLVGASTGAMALLRDDFSIIGDIVVVGGCADREESLDSSDYDDRSINGFEPPIVVDNPLLEPAVQEALKHYLAASPLPQRGAPHRRLRHGTRFLHRFLSHLEIDNCILSVVPLPRLKPLMAAICLKGPSQQAVNGEDGARRSRFTSHQRRAIHVAHAGLRWVYYSEPNLIEQRMSAPVEYAFPMRSQNPELAPRLQKVLNHLLAGGSEKALADQLNLSRHTIHEYVRQIYRIFNVNSRSELMAHWVEA